MKHFSMTVRRKQGSMPACHHRCPSTGQDGFAGQAQSGRNAGNTCLRHCHIAIVDPIEKMPLFHFLPGTAAMSIATVGCNFACRSARI
jgi:pyruvate formate lyase activating enzyme